MYGGPARLSGVSEADQDQTIPHLLRVGFEPLVAYAPPRCLISSPSTNNLTGCYEDQSLTLVVDRSASCCASGSGHAQYSEPDHDNQKASLFLRRRAPSTSMRETGSSCCIRLFVFETWLWGAMPSCPVQRIQLKGSAVDANCCYGRPGSAMVRSHPCGVSSNIRNPD